MINPFPVDPDVLARIRPIQYRDASRVAELHAAAMGTSLWARLGVAFLTELYKAMVDSPFFIGFVFIEDGEIAGFIAGSVDTSQMYRDVLKRRSMFVAPVALVGLVRNPSVLGQLWETYRYFSVSGASDVRAESLFCSFLPNLRGKRVSGHINKVLFDELLSRGESAVKVTTEVSNEGANRQLLSWGFEDRGRFRFYGKDMVTYVLDLTTSPRVQAISRHPAV